MNSKSVGRAIRLSILLIAILNAAAAPAEEVRPLLSKDSAAIISDLDALLPELLERGRVPGLQIALIRDGKIIWTKGFGVRSTADRDPVNSETIFEAASLTKPFFAYLAMMLVEEGILDLDVPLITYLPEEDIEAFLGHPLDAEGFKRDWFEKITARHVLSHSAGTPHGEGGSPRPLFFEPGTQYKYSAEGYYYLQRIVEHLKGQKLEFIMKSYVMDPLGMNQSSMVWQESYENTMANGHDPFGTPEDLRRRTEAHAGASLYTTASDYARFICAILNAEGLNERTIEQMLTPQVDVDKEKGIAWSLGFGLQTDTNGTAFWQWGDYGIYRDYVIAYPRQKTGVVYLANSYYGLSLCSELVARSIGGQALGVASLGYLPYDSPIYVFTWAVMDQGAGAVDELLSVMTAENPDLLSERGVTMIGAIFTEGKRYDEAVAFYTYVIKTQPQSAALLAKLARAHLEKGDRYKAKAYYLKAQVAEDRENFDSTAVDWALSYIKALEEPAVLSTEHLKNLEGDYETRHITFKDGKLHYFRENVSATGYRELVPLSEEIFIMEELIYFRLRFVLDEHGKPTKIIGMYEWGYEDQSLRTK